MSDDVIIDGRDGPVRMDADYYAARLSSLRSRSASLGGDEAAELDRYNRRERGLAAARGGGGFGFSTLPGSHPATGYDQEARSRSGGHIEPGQVQQRTVSTGNVGDLINRTRNFVYKEHSGGRLPDRAAELMDVAMRDTDLTESARIAAWIESRGCPAYGRAFSKILRFGREDAAMLLSGEEKDAIAAMLQSNRALSMGGGGGADGGFAVPLQLDPTVILTSSGQVNPMRQLARVEQIIGKSWLGVTSTGVTVTRTAEATEATDASPTLAQPELSTNRVQAFVPFSMEVEQDWTALQSELTRMLADAKDAEEVTSYVSGDGTGTNCGGVIGTLGTASILSTNGTASITLADAASLVSALPPRWRPGATYTAALPSIMAFSRWEQVATVSAVQGPPADRTLLNVPLKELSSMDAGTSADLTTPSQKSVGTSAQKPLLLGDFSQFLIVDRLGMNIELVPHLFGTANNFPTGQRGIYAIWRNNSAILVQSAFRALKVK